MCLRYFDKNFRCLLLSLAVYCLYLSTVTFYTNLNISNVFVSKATKSSTIVTTSTLNVARPDVTPESSSALPSITPSPAEDPYAVWLAEQKKREKEWSKNRATNKAKIMVENESVLPHLRIVGKHHESPRLDQGLVSPLQVRALREHRLPALVCLVDI